MADSIGMEIQPNTDLRLSPLGAEHAMKNWHVLGPMLEQGLDHAAGRWDMADYYQAVMDGMAEVLAVYNPNTTEVYAALLCELDQLPRRSVLTVTLCGGRDIREWLHLYPALRWYAAEKGADQIDVVGRRGWGKLLSPYCRLSTYHFIDELRDLDGLRKAS